MEKLIYVRIFKEDIELINGKYERRCLFIDFNSKNIIFIRYENRDLDYFNKIEFDTLGQGTSMDKRAGYYLKYNSNNEEEFEPLILVKFKDGKREWCRKNELTPDLNNYYNNNYESE